jgi:hypothetical protein
MIVSRRIVVVTSWLTATVLVTACGQASFPPTSPSAIGRRSSGAGSGAVITGTVSGTTLATTSSSDGFTTAATTKPVTVTVVGTNISTTIDGNGRFHLNDVPPGDVRLRFTATGLDTTLTLAGVRAGDRIDIKVRVTDTSVRIEAERRDGDDDDDDGDDDDDEVKGVVSAITGACPEITFTVNRTTVKTTSATRFDDGTCAQIRNNISVEVKGVRQADGILRATRVELED